MGHDTRHVRVKGLAARYLAGARSPQERQRLEAELEAGGEGSGELRDLDDVARALVEAVDPVEPKARIREALLARARGEAASVTDALQLMADEEIRRVVVTSRGGSTTGLLALDDIVGSLAGQAAEIGRLLRGQVHVRNEPLQGDTDSRRPAGIDA